MFKALINNEEELSIEFSGNNLSSGTINGTPFNWDIVQVENGSNYFHIIYNNQSYNASILEFDKEQKKIVVSIRGNIYHVQVSDHYDELLKKLGVKNQNSTKVKELKAPMPGLVKEIIANVGEKVSQGQSLMILEAMKMENIIKSPVEGIIKSIEVQKDKAVEKNQVLLKFQ